MKFKYGSKVKIINNEFYVDLEGVVADHETVRWYDFVEEKARLRHIYTVRIISDPVLRVSILELKFNEEDLEPLT